MKKIITFLLVLTSGLAVASQGNEWWSDISGAQARTSGETSIQTTTCRFLHLSLANMESYLSTSPMEFTDAARLKNVVLELPSPDGSFKRFRIVESPVCAPELAAKFPETRTWSGQGIDDATATVRLDVTPFGFHAMILSANGDIFIDPVNLQTTENYICYFRKDCIRRNQTSICGFNPEDEWNTKQIEELRAIYNNHHDEERSMGDNLRTYTLALACTGEYAAVFGGTVSGAHAAMVTSVNRVTGVYEKELAIRMTLIPNNDTLIYLNSATDPYDNNNGSTMLGQNQTIVSSRIGSANYDIGHVFSTGGGGIAGLGVVCTSAQKARGVTGLPNPVGDAFDIDFVAHEMGHQFGGNHTFNSVSGNCGGNNRHASAAYEPGSGITIMGYAGICSSDDLAAHSIANFHTISFDEIEDYTTFASGSSCPTTTATGNNPPTPALTDYHYDIPLMTPFTLTGIGSDPDGDTITYSWEEFDLGPGGAWNAPSGN
ncbi:MAG: reprolysin-like metallopeptidase, partial [Bacteroidota bacterium]